ncbi:tRNA nucleotidyltransferase [Methylomarinovum tepidoasis]|uniref:Multifunctional CCA protein n=1 Tax=Methylomarinovum tepidoasis TaxID=2840183 RepID=A0AAU9CBS1_9GAMM|nr:multifunctional CCA addition/repair protein [Methylomarinovum sp. IN45]BCX88171.1 tRNA nucleotidyltransferase [Methylomarinovum sp. IN45]
MEVYLVGGAVRDKLLGMPVKERDWVVVGETPESMERRGFKRVGRDFPVFLHPETHEEYALARTERKVAPGHRGFVVHASPEVTLEEDLKRRDLTINAMAMTPDGRLIDPYGGLRDLKNRVLRHVSEAFVEDPLRVLRVARFAAKLAHLGFRVAPETMALMRQMVAAGEVDALTPERVWQELVKALAERTPARFFEVLRECGANARLFPEIERLFGVPQPVQWHPEIDTGIHTLMALTAAARLTPDTVTRFAALTHDLGKGLTPPEMWPSHRGHEQRGLEPLAQLCQRLKAPRAYHRLARKVMQYHGLCHRVFELKPATIVEVLYQLDVLHEDRDFEPFLKACEADVRGRKGWEDKPYPQADWWRALRRAALAVRAGELVAKGLKGEALGIELRQARIRAVAVEKRRLQASRRDDVLTRVPDKAP